MRMQVATGSSSKVDICPVNTIEENIILELWNMSSQKTKVIFFTAHHNLVILFSFDSSI
jgi:hypothetical protein